MTSTAFPSLNPPIWPARLTRAGLWVIAIGVLAALVSGPLHRFAVLGVMPALLTLAVGLALVVIGALLTIIGFLVASARRVAIPRVTAVIGIVIALVVIGYLLTWVQKGRSTPPIHEISTDLASPPPFVAVKDIRARIKGIAPAQYEAHVGPGGAIDVPAMQQRYYPDIKPLHLAVPPAAALSRAQQVARQLGWKIDAFVPAQGRLEATDSTRFFGFKDDIVVRVQAETGGARVDVRSKSRVGLGDVGTNAARVRKFLQLMRQ